MNSEKSPAIQYIDGKYEQTGPIPVDDKEIEVLGFINSKIASGETLADIIDFLFRETQEIIPSDRIAVSFFEEEGKRVTIHHVSAGYDTLHLAEGYSAEIQGSSLEKVFASGLPRVINDIDLYLKDHPTSESTALLLREGIKSSITCPLRVEERPVGLLFISSKKPRAYDDKSLKLYLMISERLSQAVEKAYRIEQLTKAMDSYMEMLGFVSHEMKSPLDSIITLGKTLAGGYFGPIDERNRQYVERMVKKAEYLVDISSDYLTLSRFETGSIDINAREIDFLSEVIQESLEIVYPQIKGKNNYLTLNHPDTIPPVSCDPTLMKIVTGNLLSNAVKYSDEGGEIRVNINADADTVTVSVYNSGPGFPPDQKQMLFRKFSRLQTGELLKRKGTGVGLYTTWKIIKLHGGSIYADSSEGEWAEFTFEIPLTH